jgi:hypothetical protein
MPSHVPRSDTSKKRGQLERREQELEHAIRTALSREELVRAAEAMRAAHLSLLKAELYWAEDAKIAGRDIDARIRNIRRDTQKWTERSIDEILDDHTTA